MNRFNLKSNSLGAKEHRITQEHFDAKTPNTILDTLAEEIAQKCFESYKKLIANPEQIAENSKTQASWQIWNQKWVASFPQKGVGNNTKINTKLQAPSFSVYDMYEINKMAEQEMKAALNPFNKDEWKHIGTSYKRLPKIAIYRNAYEYLFDEVAEQEAEANPAKTVEEYVSAKRYMELFQYLQEKDISLTDTYKNQALVTLSFAVHYYLIAKYKATTGEWK